MGWPRMVTEVIGPVGGYWLGIDGGGGGGCDGEVVTVTLFVFHPVLPFWGILRWKVR